MKKIIALIIVCTLLLPAFSGIAAENDYKNHWAYDYINYLKENNVVSGDSDGKMNPENPITRAEFAQVTNKAFGFTEEGSKRFSDVS